MEAIATGERHCLTDLAEKSVDGEANPAECPVPGAYMVMTMIGTNQRNNCRAKIPLGSSLLEIDGVDARYIQESHWLRR